MTEEEKKKREQQQAGIVKQEFAPVSPVTPSTPTQQPSVQDGDLRYGGIYDRLVQRRDEVATAEAQAKKNWRKVYEETGDVMAGFVPKPVDTTGEQKRLRRAAIAQALGELVGTIGQGIVAFGRGGEGYVTAPMGMYNNTMQKLQDLKDKGLADQKEYEALMARIRMQQQRGRVEAAKDEADRYQDERMAYDKIIADYERRLREKQYDAEKAREERAFKKEESALDRENQIKAAQIRAANKSQKPTNGLTEDESRILYAMLPKERFVKTVDGDGKERIVTQPYAKYPEEKLRAYSSIAKTLARAGVTEKDVLELAGLLEAKGSDWGVVSATMSRGVPIGDIIAHVRKLPDAKKPNGTINSDNNGKR